MTDHVFVCGVSAVERKSEEEERRQREREERELQRLQQELV